MATPLLWVELVRLCLMVQFGCENLGNSCLQKVSCRNAILHLLSSNHLKMILLFEGSFKPLTFRVNSLRLAIGIYVYFDHDKCIHKQHICYHMSGGKYYYNVTYKCIQWQLFHTIYTLYD